MDVALPGLALVAVLDEFDGPVAGAHRVGGVGAVPSSEGRRGVRGGADMVGPSGARSEVDGGTWGSSAAVDTDEVT